MKTLIQKLPLDKDNSFVARTYRTPLFETPYHIHSEYELMVIKEGYGTAFVGSLIKKYQTGDVYLFGKNYPHWFRKKDEDMIGSSMVIHFQEDCLGDHFFDLPEMKSIRDLLRNSSKGIYLTDGLRKIIGKKIIELEHLNGFLRLVELLMILYDISNSSEYEFVSESEMVDYSLKEQNLIAMVFEHSMQNFRRKISLQEMAELTNRSVSAFCHYFKKATKICYIHFLTQIRINHACEMLKNSNLSITEVCYESGFHNWANFSKHFKTHCKMSPSKFRSLYAETIGGMAVK